jgi:Amt family ammonium transporter
LIDKAGIDDVVGAISVHLVGGIWGTLAVGIPVLNGSGDFLVQLIGVVAIGLFVTITSAIVWLTMKYTIGLRPSEEDEITGLDVSEVGMEAYPEFNRSSH